jgi:hypothetical protein
LTEGYELLPVGAGEYPTEIEAGWLQAFRDTLLKGLGEATIHRHCGSAEIKEDIFTLKCTLMDPRFKTFHWCTSDGSATPRSIREETLESAKMQLLNEAVAYWSGNFMKFSYLKEGSSLDSSQNRQTATDLNRKRR